MQKMLKMTLCILMIAALAGCKPAVTTGTDNTVPLEASAASNVTSDTDGLPKGESPRTYLLTGDDSMTLMPTVTLYADGSARLSQPMISSTALFGLGQYAVDGDTLTVTYDEGSRAEFSVSGGGDTLILKDTNVGFTKAGSVYQYQSRADYLSQYTRIDGEELTLEAVRELALKASSLTYADFEKYAHYDIDPDNHVYDIEGKYTLSVICGSDGSTSIIVENNESGERFLLNLNGSTGLVFDEYLCLLTVPKYTAAKWLDYYLDDKMPWDSSQTLTLPEFPDVTFTWTSEKVTANGTELLWGMPVWNVYLTDLTNDGKPEICATVSIGSGIADTRVIVCDYATGQEYELADRMTYDYYLSFEDGKVMVTQCEYRQGKPLVTMELKLVNGEIDGF